MYLTWNASTQIYRYQIGTAVWSTTSANSANPAIPVAPGAVGAGVWLRWAPWIVGYTDKLVLIRGAWTANIYTYDLVSNTWATPTLSPQTETFAWGTCSWCMVNQSTGKQDRIFISSSNFQNSNIRILEINLITWRIDMVSTLTLYPSGAAVVWDKMTIIQSPDGYQVIYQLLHTSNAVIRDFSISVL